LIGSFLLPNTSFAKSFILPSPVLDANPGESNDPQSRRRFVYDYVDKYVKEYISEFIRLNGSPANKFNLEETKKKAKAPFVAKSDAQIMMVNPGDIQILKNTMDEIAINLYNRSELTRYNAMKVDNSIVEVFAKMNKDIQDLATRLDKGTKVMADMNAAIQRQDEEISRLQSKAALATAQAGLTKPGTTLVTPGPVESTNPKIPIILSMLAMAMAGFAIFKRN
jgi:hypothetical protein